MKCKAKVWYTKVKRRVQHIKPYWSPEWDTVPENAEICDGEIQVSLELYEEPEWGGTSPALMIEYKCNKCGNNDFPELPTYTCELGRFLQKIIPTLPEENRKRWADGDTGE